MDILNLNFTGGLPLRQDRLRWMQDSIRLAIGHLAMGPRALMSFDVSQNPVYLDGYVIYGCAITNNGDGTASVADGAIALNNEVFQVDAHVVTLSVVAFRTYYFAPSYVVDSPGTVEYFSGVSHATQGKKRAHLTFTEYPTLIDAGDDFLTLANENVMVTEAGGVFTFTDFMMAISPPPVTVAKNGMWAATAGYVKVQRDVNGKVTLAINTLSPGLHTDGVIAVLPHGYRPTSRHHVMFEIIGGSKLYIGILTDGTVIVEDDASDPWGFVCQPCVDITYFI